MAKAQQKGFWRSLGSHRALATLSVAIFGFAAMALSNAPASPRSLQTQTTTAGSAPHYGYQFSPHGINKGEMQAGSSFTEIIEFSRYDSTQLGTDNVRFKLDENSTAPSWCWISPTNAIVDETSHIDLTVNCTPGEAQVGPHSIMIISTSESDESQGLWATNSTLIEFSVKSKEVCGDNICSSNETPATCASDCNVPSPASGGDPLCMWHDDDNNCIPNGVFAFTTQYDGGQPRWCQALGTQWECRVTNPNEGSSTSTTPSTGTNGTSTTPSTGTNGTTDTNTSISSPASGGDPLCMWHDDDNNCVPDGVFAYTTQYDGGQPRWCQALGTQWVCLATNPNGEGSTSTTTTPSTGTNGTTDTTYHDPGTCTTESGSEGLECSVCTDSTGQLTSKSCWIPYSGDGTYNAEVDGSSKCDYYLDQGLQCMSCYNKSGKLTNQSCSQSYSTGGDYGDPNAGFYEANVTCDYKEEKVEGQNYSNWCEICTKPGGEVVKDSCNGDDERWDDRDDDRGGRTCWQENGCEICVDEEGNEEQWCDDDRDDDDDDRDDDDDGDDDDDRHSEENFMDDESRQQQIRDMKENVRWRQHDLKEFSRLEKRTERKAKEFEQKIKQIERDIEWMERDGFETKQLEKIVEDLNDAIAELGELKQPIAQDREAFDRSLKELQSTLDTWNSKDKLTWDHNDALWLLLQQNDLFQWKRDIYDGKINFYDMKDGYYEWLKEKEKVLSELDQNNIKLKGDQKKNLDIGDEWIDEFNELHSDFLKAAKDVQDVIQKAPTFGSVDALAADWEKREAVREYFFDAQDAVDDLRWARDGLNAHGFDHQLLWDMLNELQRLRDASHNTKWIQEELNNMSATITVFEEAVNALQGKLDKVNQKRLDETASIIPKAKAILANLEKAMQELGDDPGAMAERMDGFWQDLDRMKNYVDPRLDQILEYVRQNWEQFNFSESEREAVQRLMDDRGPGHGPDECMNCNRLDDVYGGDVAQKLKERIKIEIMQTMLPEIINQVKATVMEAVSKAMENERGKIYEVILNHFDQLKGEKFGQDFGNKLLENGVKVTEAIDTVDLDEARTQGRSNDQINQFSELRTRFSELPMPTEDLAARVKTYWSDVQADIDRNADAEDFTARLEEGWNLFNEAENAKFEYHLAFKDFVSVLDPDYVETRDWFSMDVITGALDGRWEGYKDNSGNRTFMFGPSDQTLRAEALKMVLRAFGYSEAFGESESGSGQSWWSGWENRGRELGISLVDHDLTQPITRGEMMRLIYEVGGIEDPGSFEVHFSDVSVSDDWKPANTLAGLGIVRGDGETGNASLGRTLNRAESAALINRAVKWNQDNQFASEEVVSYSLPSENSRLERKASTSWLRTTGQLMKVFLPIF